MSIASGSSGNCYWVESHGVNLLIDLGVRFKHIHRNLMGQNVSKINAVLVTHAHSDHINEGSKVSLKNFDCPVYMTTGTFSECRDKLCGISNILHFESGDEFKLEHITIESYKTSHDALDSVIYLFDDGESRLGIITDLGIISDDIEKAISTLDVLYMEANYDKTILFSEQCQYPIFLKERIDGVEGHLSNEDSAKALSENYSDSLKYLVLSHISNGSNSEALAMTEFTKAFGNEFPFEIMVAPREKAGSLITL